MKQRTFTANGEKITIKIRRRSHIGNFNGFRVIINGHKFDVLTLDPVEAEDKAFAQWVDKYSKAAKGGKQ